MGETLYWGWWPIGGFLLRLESYTLMEYPSGFPEQSRAAVEAEELRASREFAEVKQSIPWSASGPGEDLAAGLIKFILRIYAAFVREIYKLDRVWELAVMRFHAGEFLKSLTIKAWQEKGYDSGGTIHPGQIRRLPEMTSHWNGAILPPVMNRLEESVQWRECEEALLKVAEAQAARRNALGAGPEDAALAQSDAGVPGRSPFSDDPAKAIPPSHLMTKDGTSVSKRRHGFPPDMIRHNAIAEVVNRLVGSARFPG